MNKFEEGGKKYWENFGKVGDLPPRTYFDFVGAEKYKQIFKKYNLKGKSVVDLGAGYPLPKIGTPQKESIPLASELHEILENKGANIIAVDVAEEPLKAQSAVGRKSILGSFFKPPFKNESVDGGVIILNVFSSSFGDENRKETYIKTEDCRKILQEVYRILQKGGFVVVNNYGYIIGTMDNSMKFLGPEENEINTSEIIQKMAKEIGFTKIENIPIDKNRFELGQKIIMESFPEALRDRIILEIKGTTALVLEK